MEKDELQGLWQAVRAEVNGCEAEEAEFKGFQILIKGDTMTFLPDNRSALFDLDPSKLPKTMDLTPKDGPAKGKKLPAGIYTLEGDELHICLNNASDNSRPSGFKTYPGDGMRFLTLRRIKDEPTGAAKGG